MNEPYFTAINAIIDTLFLVDIIISFRTTYVDPSTGDEIQDLRQIANHYLRSRFWLDLLATIPIDQFAELIVQESVTALQMFGLLKLVRVLRLGRIIAYLNLKDDVKMSLKLMKLVFFLVIYIHCWACLWFLIVKGDQVLQCFVRALLSSLFCRTGCLRLTTFGLRRTFTSRVSLFSTGSPSITLCSF